MPRPDGRSGPRGRSLLTVRQTRLNRGDIARRSGMRFGPQGRDIGIAVVARWRPAHRSFQRGRALPAHQVTHHRLRQGLQRIGCVLRAGAAQLVQGKVGDLPRRILPCRHLRQSRIWRGRQPRCPDRAQRPRQNPRQPSSPQQDPTRPNPPPPTPLPWQAQFVAGGRTVLRPRISQSCMPPR